MAHYGKTKFPGILASDTAIQINFRLSNGVRRREIVKLQPTKPNLKYASQKLGTIQSEITIGTFNYAVHFPDSKWLLKNGVKGANVRVRDMIWSELIISEKDVRKNTLDGYKAGRRAVETFLGDELISGLTITDLILFEAHLRDVRGVVTKTIANHMIPLRHLCQWAVNQQILSNNPFHNYKLKKTQDEQTDQVLNDRVEAFDVGEVNLILGSVTGQIANLIQFAIWSGLRPSEYFALTWENVDLVEQTISVEFGISRGNYSLPKNKGSRRTIKLSPQAYEALANQRQHTYMKPPTEFRLGSKERKGRFVFYDPAFDRPFTDDQRFQKGFWRGIFKKHGIRYLPPYAMRHTFASLSINSGEPPRWIARQMGHRSTEMVYRHYGHWLKDAEKLAGTGGGDKLAALADKMKEAKC